MIFLNLLPPRRKEDIALLRLYVLIKNLIIFCLFFLILVAIILLLTKLQLQKNFQTIVEETAINTRLSSGFNQDIKKFNTLIGAVDTVQSDYIPWTKLLITFSNLIPENIVLSELIISQNTLTISGYAPDRKDLLLLKEIIETSQMFKDLEIPIDQLIQKDSISFNLRTSIVPEYFE